MPAFLNFLILPGLLFATAPILIHIFNRNKYVELKWGAYQLLLEAIRSQSRRLKFEDILLLLLRTLLLLVFILALCRLVFTFKGITWGNPLSSNVVVIDGTYSMGRETDDGPLFDQARKEAIKLIEGMRKGSDVSVIIVGRVPHLLSPKPEFDFEKVIKQITEFKPHDEAGDYILSLDLAVQVLNGTKNPMRRLYIFGDMQKFGWNDTRKTRWQKIKTRIENSKVELNTFYSWEEVKEKPNYSVSPITLQGVYVNRGEPARFAFAVTNHYKKAGKVKIVIEQDNKDIDTFDMHLDPGEHLERTFETTFDSAGNHVLKVRIDEDFIPGDNIAYMAIKVLHKIPILIVDGDHSNVFDTASGSYLEIALDPELSPDKKTTFDCKRVGAAEFEEMELSAYRGIVLADVPTFSQQTVRKLENYVADGGGLLITCGENSNAGILEQAFYAEEGRGLLPAIPIKVHDPFADTPEASIIDQPDAPETDNDFGTDAQGKKSPLSSPYFPKGKTDIFPFFKGRKAIRITEVLVAKYMIFEVTEEDLQEGAQVLATFRKDHPFIVEKRYGNGRVVLWTTTLNNKWGSNLPGRPVFVLLINHLMLYIAAEYQNNFQVVQGDKIAISIRTEADPDDDDGADPGGEDSGESTPKKRAGGDETKAKDAESGESGADEQDPDTGILYVKTPDPEEEIQEEKANRMNRFLEMEYSKTSRPGIYKVSDDKSFPDERTRIFAVNIDDRESRLEPMEDDFREALQTGYKFSFIEGYKDLLKGKHQTKTFDAWRWLMVAAIILLLAESYVASHYHGKRKDKIQLISRFEQLSEQS